MWRFHDCTEAEKIRFVNDGDNMLSYVKNPSEKVCLEAVKFDGLSLRYVPNENQTDEICMAAIKRNPYALCYVREQTEEMCVLAVKQDFGALVYVEEFYDSVFELIKDIDSMVTNAYKEISPERELTEDEISKLLGYKVKIKGEE